jgi:NNP family nitrate/nitrite transporter-like MFS transporter
MPAFPFPVGAIAFLTGIFYLNFVSRVMLGPFLPLIEHELGLGHGGAGSLFFFIQIGYAAGLLGSGVVSGRFTRRCTIIISSIAVGLAMLGLSRSVSLGEIRLWLAILGTAAGLYLPSGIAAITHLSSEAHWGKALAVHELAPNLGFVTAPLIAEALLAVISWRGVLAVVGCGGILLGGCFALWGHAGDLRGEPPRLQNVARVARDPSLWVMALLLTVGIGSGLGLYSMLPLFLVNEVGMPRAGANTITGLSRLSCLAVLFVAGWLTDRTGDRRALLLCLTTTGALTLCMGLFPGPTLTPVFIFVQAAAGVLFFPPAFAAVSRIAPTQMRNLAISLTTAVGVILGGGGVPAGIGYLAEVASFSLAFTLLGALVLLSPLLLLLGSRPEPKHCS